MAARTRDIERQMLGAFATVARQWGATPLEGHIAKRLGLSIEDSEIRIIYILGARTDDMRPGDLAEQLSVSRPSLSKSLTRLRTAGIVESEVANDDRRSVYVTLTEAGKEAYATLINFGTEIIHSVNGGLTVSELETVKGFLERFAERLGGPGPVVLPPEAR
ncbi:MarR family winged helix-turn-helix transcriptional regulator [Leucobacter sp. BZR 635]|uniref:MarR family winged helix-turn-helix transcriptional regulator n=1 Tax=Leucobacter sp. BZR 635 TaxID=3378705 RepID=UPI003A887F2E